MAGDCLQFNELLQGWKAECQDVKRHVQDCDRCRQMLLVAGGLRSLHLKQGPRSAGFHLWKKRIQEHDERVARATLPISAMSFVATVVALTGLALAFVPGAMSPPGILMRVAGSWILENELILWIGGTLAMATVLTGILSLEEE